VIVGHMTPEQEAELNKQTQEQEEPQPAE